MVTAVRNEKYVTRNISHFKKFVSTMVGLNLQEEEEEEEGSDEEIEVPGQDIPQDSQQGNVPHSSPRSDLQGRAPQVVNQNSQ